MSGEQIVYKPIGIIRTPFTDPAGMPIQPVGGADVRGTVEMRPEFRAGLKDLDGFSHIILIYHLHRACGYDLDVVPFMDSQSRGIFATRAPRRPNAIGLSVVRLEKISGGTLHIRDVDMLDETPLLDIKPYVPGFTDQGAVRIGWVGAAGDKPYMRKSDDRFV